jgi:hypothetical protein
VRNSLHYIWDLSHVGKTTTRSGNKRWHKTLIKMASNFLVGLEAVKASLCGGTRHLEPGTVRFELTRESVPLLIALMLLYSFETLKQEFILEPCKSQQYFQ